MQEDYFKREIDRLGQVLAKLILSLLGKSSNQGSDEVVFAITNSFAELDIDLEALLACTPANASDKVWDKLGNSTPLLEQFADSLVISGKLALKSNQPLSTKLLKIAMACYAKLEQESRAFSFTVNDKKADVTSILDSSAAI
ncbi:MAG: hypothetical protein JW783_01775 [Bacteroidales bacterium]|nr:hypothetical protein [Bacteroidales bacterium]MBN2750922.1 hypothetical protein [Bacteroidales bacterium]